MAKMINGREVLKLESIILGAQASDEAMRNAAKRGHMKKVALNLGRALLDRLSSGVPVVLEVVENDERNIPDGSIELETEMIIGRLAECTEANTKAAPKEVNRVFEGIDSLEDEDAIGSGHE